MNNAISIRSVAMTSCAFLVGHIILPAAFSQELDRNRRNIQQQSAESQDLLQQIRAMQKKIAVLEANLKQKHSEHSGSNAISDPQGKMKGKKKMDAKMMNGMKGSGSKSTPPMMTRKGMKGMGVGKGGMGMMKMESMSGSGMKGMGSMSDSMMKMQGAKSMSRGMMMMGKMKSMGTMSTPSSLPGFPGASHIYHIGADGFFLNHEKHISLTEAQQQSLNKIKEEALLNQAEMDRKIESAEQQSWVLTASDRPDFNKIKAKIDEIALMQVQQRISFIQAVGKAAAVLTDQQRATLTGTSDGSPKTQ